MARFAQAMEKGLIGAIQLYRFCLSPWIGNHCRFDPTCSQYALEAIQHYGCAKGVFLILKRLSKCHPWHSGGVDRVLPNAK